jgi:hypothetical protein
MRWSRVLPCLLSVCLAFSVLTAGVASAKPGAGREAKTYKKAESDFSRSVKSLPLSAADGGYDAGKVAKQREARIAKQGRDPCSMTMALEKTTQRSSGPGPAASLPVLKPRTVILQVGW